VERAGSFRPEVAAVPLIETSTNNDFHIRLDLQVVVGQITVVTDDDHAGGIWFFGM
jgi:hypothetical protein